jgi:hypothetical protein
VYVDR